MWFSAYQLWYTIGQMKMLRWDCFGFVHWLCWLSEYEIKSIFDKIGSTDLNKEFKKPIKRFSNLVDAKKYVKNSISKKSRDWLKNNETMIDEIAKKLLG